MRGSALWRSSLISLASVPLRPERAVDWSLHIGADRSEGKAHRRVISPRALIELPTGALRGPSGDEYASLAARDLARGPIAGLASGEAIARELGIAPLDADGGIGLESRGWRYETPLWLYVLREAEVLLPRRAAGPSRRTNRRRGARRASSTSDRESFRTLEPDLATRGSAGNGSVFARGRLVAHGVELPVGLATPEACLAAPRNEPLRRDRGRPPSSLVPRPARRAR